MSNAQTVHELFALRSQAKTPEEKQAISYAIDQAAQAMKRKPSPTDVRFVRQTKEYFEQKRDYPKGKETPIPPKEEKPKPQLYLTPEQYKEAQKKILPDPSKVHPGVKPGYTYGTGTTYQLTGKGEPPKVPSKLDVVETRTYIRSIKEDVPTSKIKGVYKEELGRQGYVLVEEGAGICYY